MAQPTQPVLAPEDRHPNEDEVRALRGVEDPEFRVSIQDLGLVYGVRRQHCGTGSDSHLARLPFGPMIIVRVWAMIMGRFPLVQVVGVTFVWRPAWGPRTMATEDSRTALGIW